MLRPLILLSTLTLTSCMNFDMFMFAGQRVDSLDDYYGLPICGDPGSAYCSPYQEASIDRELYLDISGQRIAKTDLEHHQHYIHGAFLRDDPLNDGPLHHKGITIQILHGNAGHLWRYWSYAVVLWRMGANVLIYTWRGYGLSEGDSNQQTVFEDALAVSNYLTERIDADSDLRKDRLGIYAHSLGAVPAAYLLGDDSGVQDRYAFGILDAPVESVSAVTGQSVLVSMPAGFFFNANEWDTIDRMHGAKAPVLHMHGQADDVNYFYQAQNIQQSFSELLPRYTAYMGLGGPRYELFSEAFDEAIAEATHRNIPVFGFRGFEHLLAFYNEEDNPHHCCVSPLEFADPRNREFVLDYGDATPEEVLSSHALYHDAVADWILHVVGPGS